MNIGDLFPDGDYRFQMGLSRGSPDDFFRPTAAHATLIAERRAWLQDAPGRYAAALPECAPLLEETFALARSWMQPEAAGEFSQAQSLEDRNRALGKALEPDFLLLKPEAAGPLRLVAGCVCFPSSWSLAEKMGRPLDLIHAPVPGLNAELGKQIQTFLGRIAPGIAWLRSNWGLSASPELNQHPERPLPRLGPAAPLGDAWLRVEHQALVALPESRGILFGIRISVLPVAELKRDPVAARKLARALRTMPEEVAVYKNIAGARAGLLALLEA